MPPGATGSHCRNALLASAGGPVKMSVFVTATSARAMMRVSSVSVLLKVL